MITKTSNKNLKLLQIKNIIHVLLTLFIFNYSGVSKAMAQEIQLQKSVDVSNIISTSEIIEDDGSASDFEIVILDSEESLWNWAREVIEFDPLSIDADDFEKELFEMIQNFVLNQEALQVKVKAYKRTCAALEVDGAAEGTASWYGPGFHGRKTANGERFNQNDLTAAHKTLPFNSIVEVTYKGKTVRVRINDAGPYSGNRIIDLSKEAARQLGLIAPGTGRVTLVLISCGNK